MTSSRANPRFGYRHEGGSLVQDVTEQATIQKVVRLKEEGDSFNRIAGYLNSLNELNRGRFWSPTTIRTVYHRAKEDQEKSA